ncbi:MAG: hypothetical protein RIQ89_1143 [Bacteroidota bacterium]|jgi:hypothetical protein
MKKFFLTLLIVILISKVGVAQCVPDPLITGGVPGIYPDTATNLPVAVVGTPYSSVIQIKVLTDTTVGGLPAIIDSIVIFGVTGLPAGFTYSCTPASCSFPGGSDACILLQGPAFSISELGNVYPIVVNGTAYGSLFGLPASQPYDVDGYKIVVTSNVSATLLTPSKFDAAQNQPNPFSTESFVHLNLPSAGKYQLKVMDLLGRTVMNSEYQGIKGINIIKLNAIDFKQGVYTYSVSFGSSIITKKMIVSGN